MYHFFTTVLTSPILGSFVGAAIALTLLGLLVALSIYAGLYYTVPRMLLKWLTRRCAPCRMTWPHQSRPSYVRNNNNALAICARNRTMAVE